ncbi:LysR family transcriptional regulator [Aliiroseovarius crassostreae]|uniref:LysR family transcriptional regulator n=1 Tax=Aliiroseovarius crassostreae TaxID=154981 RepID=A0A9Q9HG91_9RHOB|nr:LysR family transcriptional regulator [Aliiroseovarius crassostreae]UWP90303.1 LysR family transcriptional regulator [Aliiroseovarius crassostreae]UWP96637.1 LysR family transcriptional regulator [Aliiroseovarius crassostreae]UWP99752.1 LysR family transcriptional regulator [Aliiroseovarius crassostreae]UWQ02967.1 LysR family transcriptional regulator [Aliiroseovarius crassostreae]
MSIKIEMLRGFAAVARSGNLSDGALSLGRTPSAVSMMLKQLETHLGEPLFETDRKNRLTALGAFVLEQAERELQQFDSTVKAIEGFAKASHGYVSIAVVPSVAGTVIPDVFSRFIDEFENIDIELRDMDSTSIQRELARGRVDIGIATLSENAIGLHSQYLMSDRFGVIASPDHKVAQVRGPIDWAELEDVRLIANSLSAGITAPQSRDLHAKAMLSAHNLTSIMSMVRANIGVTIIPAMASLALQPNDLVFRPLADDTIRRQIHLLRNAASPQSPAARLLERRIRETAADLAVRFPA